MGNEDGIINQNIEDCYSFIFVLYTKEKTLERKFVLIWIISYFVYHPEGLALSLFWIIYI